MSKQLSSSIIDHFSSSSNINDVWEFFKEGCQKIIEDKVPTRTTSQRFTQPWINRDIRRITRLKRRWFRRATRSKQPQDWNRYKALKKQAQKACRDTHDEFVITMLTNDSANPKRFWNFIKSRQKNSTGVGPLKTDGLTFSDSLNKANIMGEQFCSVYTRRTHQTYQTLAPARHRLYHQSKSPAKEY